jgi:hypothetical protein
LRAKGNPRHNRPEKTLLAKSDDSPITMKPGWIHGPTPNVIVDVDLRPLKRVFFP